MNKLENYGLLGVIKLFFFKIRTFFVFRNARLIRFPLDLRGKKFISLGKGFTCGPGCRIEAYSSSKKKVLFIGENVQLNDYVHIASAEKVIIGNNVLMASKIFITDISHGDYGNHGDERSFPEVSPSLRPLSTKSVEIGDNVWIGEFVSILPGVKIGKGSIIGSNSVVSRSIPENVIAVGTPAKIVKKFDSESKKWVKV